MALFTAGKIYAAIVVVLITSFVALLRDVLTNPLRKIPGPWYTLWTDVVLKYHVLKGHKAIYVHQLHVHYGPVVRISPTQADISDLSAVQRIHQIGNEFVKSDWYKTMSVDQDNVFNTSDMALHRRYRRLLSSPMSESGLKAMRPTVDERVKLMVDKVALEMKERGGVADVMKWATFMSTDVISELTFGESFRLLEAGKKNSYIRDMEAAAPLLALRALFPLIRRLIGWGFPIPGFKKAVEMIQRTSSSAQNRLERHRKLAEESNAESLKPTLFTKLYRAHDEDREALRQQDIQSNAELYIIAGSDTTAHTLTYLLWAVAKHPTVRKKLVEELRTKISRQEPLDYEELRGLPYLNCVIEEALRMYPPIPSTLPRIVPPGGVELAGYWFEGGVCVSTQAYSLHRNPETFPEPHKFNPDRWEEPAKTMRDSSFWFGGGSRICLGLHLGLMELRLATARFFLQFPDAKVSEREGMCDDDMEQLTYFLAFPKGRRCLIQAS